MCRNELGSGLYDVYILSAHRIADLHHGLAVRFVVDSTSWPGLDAQTPRDQIR